MMFAPRYTVWHCGYLKKGKREMSDTPKSDEAKWETAPAAIVVSIYFAQTLERENVALREQLKDCSAVVDRQQKQLDRNAEQLAALHQDASSKWAFLEWRDRAEKAEAKIDSLMLEYCPIEMSLEQIARWKKHQIVKEERK